MLGMLGTSIICHRVVRTINRQLIFQVVFCVPWPPTTQAAWSPQSAGAQTLRAQDPEKFQVYAMGGALLSEEVLKSTFRLTTKPLNKLNHTVVDPH